MALSPTVCVITATASASRLACVQRLSLLSNLSNTCVCMSSAYLCAAQAQCCSQETQAREDMVLEGFCNVPSPILLDERMEHSFCPPPLSWYLARCKVKTRHSMPICATYLTVEECEKSGLCVETLGWRGAGSQARGTQSHWSAAPQAGQTWQPSGV